MNTKRNTLSGKFLPIAVMPAMVLLTMGCMLWQPLAPDAFPDTDLVFQPNTLFDGVGAIGFVNADDYRCVRDHFGQSCGGR